ncbi:hypothetical protein ACSQ67_013844 [Phaseolus vulgaris]
MRTKSSVGFISLSFSMLFSTSYPNPLLLLQYNLVCVCVRGHCSPKPKPHCHSVNRVCKSFIFCSILFFLLPLSLSHRKLETPIFSYILGKKKSKDRKMNTFGSEIRSSGCESGWTLYLDHSFLNQNASSHQHKDKRFKDEDSGEEDLSMLSDASSGPPHFPHYDSYFNQDVNGCFYSASKAVKLAKSAKKKQKVKENQHLEDQHPTFLHDTASSPVFDFSTENVTRGNQQTSVGSVVDYSQGSSATYFEGRSSFQEEHFGFLQSKNELEDNKWYGGKRMGIR